MTDGRLKRCPHCGGEATVCLGSKLGDEEEYVVQCDDCFSLSDQFYDEESAVRAWNMRAALDEWEFSRAVHDGRLWVCVDAAAESDHCKPIPGFTKDSIYRDSMLEYGEWMEKATALMRDLWTAAGPLVAEEDYFLSCALGDRLREFGIGDET